MIIDIILFVFVEYICMKDAIVFKLISIGVRFILRVIGVIMSFSIYKKLLIHLNGKRIKYFL